MEKEKEKERDAGTSHESLVNPLKVGIPDPKMRMSSKELMLLIMLYMTDPNSHSKQPRTNNHFQMQPGKLLRKLQELRYRIDYLEVNHLKYGLKHLEEQGKLNNMGRSMYRINTDRASK